MHVLAKVSIRFIESYSYLMGTCHHEYIATPTNSVIKEHTFWLFKITFWKLAEAGLLTIRRDVNVQTTTSYIPEYRSLSSLSCFSKTVDYSICVPQQFLNHGLQAINHQLIVCVFRVVIILCTIYTFSTKKIGAGYDMSIALFTVLFDNLNWKVNLQVL